MRTPEDFSLGNLFSIAELKVMAAYLYDSVEVISNPSIGPR